MGFRFRKRIRLFPGVSINLSKSGVTTSIGGRGATLNVGGKRGPRVTVGLPGTGISYSENLSELTNQQGQPAGTSLGALLIGVLVVLVLGAALYGLLGG